MEIYHPLAFLRNGWTHRRLILRLARRKIEARYRGSILGLIWVLIQPLLMLAIYAFVFGTVLGSRWPLAQVGDAPFALVLFSGMVLYSVFSECVNEAPNLMLANEIHIKQMRFPIEILPWVSLVAALFGFSINLALLVAFYFFAVGPPPLALLWIPLILAPLALMTLGVTWMFSWAGVFLRDLNQIAGILTTALLFLSPVFYTIERIPESLRPLYALNPFVPLIESFRGALFANRFPDNPGLLAVGAGAWAVAWLGYIGFMRTKKGFADVL